MLAIWTEEDPDATIENLKSILKELNYNEALEVINNDSIKPESNSVKAEPAEN